MKQLIEDRYIGAKIGDTIGVVDRRGFIAPDGGGGSGIHHIKISFTGTSPSGDVIVEKETEQ